MRNTDRGFYISPSVVYHKIAVSMWWYQNNKATLVIGLSLIEYRLKQINAWVNIKIHDAPETDWQLGGT